MEDWLYMMFIEKTKTYNKLTKAAVERHVANLRSLDEQGHLTLAGVFKGYPGVAGMYILRRRATRRRRSFARRSLLWWRALQRTSSRPCKPRTKKITICSKQRGAARRAAPFVSGYASCFLERFTADKIARRGARLMLWDSPTPQYFLPVRCSCSRI